MSWDIAFILTTDGIATGAIYLPPGYSTVVPATTTELCQMRVDPAKLTQPRLEAVVREQTGKTVSLQPGTYRAMRLQKLDDFTSAALAELQPDSTADRVIFRASSE